MKQFILGAFLVTIAGSASGQVYHGVAVAPNGLDAWVIDIESVATYHTPDFGESWEPQDIPTTRRLFGVFFLDEQRGWTCGDIGAIHATTDGGVNWFRQNLGGPKFSSRIQFLDTMHGWSSGGTAMLLVTDDGGSTWRLDYFPNPPFVPETVDFQGLSFVDTETGWLAAGRYPELDTFGNPTLFTRGQGYIAKVTASGDTFIHELQHKDTVYDFYDVHFVDAEYGWVVGGEDSTMAAVVFHTTNGGTDWFRQDVPSQARFLRAVDFVDRQHGWACGRNGTIIRTTDGGASWHYQQAVSDTTLFDIDFVDSLRGMIAGNSIIMYTTDGGEQWIRCFGGVEEPRRTLEAQRMTLDIRPNPARGWAVVRTPLAARTLASVLRIFDASGRLIMQSPIRSLKEIPGQSHAPHRLGDSPGFPMFQIDLGGLSPGVYHCRVEPAGMSASLVLVGE